MRLSKQKVVQVRNKGEDGMGTKVSKKVVRSYSRVMTQSLNLAASSATLVSTNLILQLPSLITGPMANNA